MRLLIIDDRDVTHVRDHICRANPDNVVATVSDGESATFAIDAAAGGGVPFDVVLCDWDLGPDVPTGDVLCRLLRIGAPGARFILWSGLDHLADVPDGMEFYRKDMLLELLTALGMR